MNPNVNNILILGVTGFIGREVYKHLRFGYPDLYIHLLIRTESKAKDFKQPNTKVYIGSIETFQWKRITSPIDVVFHFARNSSSRGRRLGRHLVSAIGWYGNRRLIQFLEKKSVTQLYYLSASLMYGSHTEPIEESAGLNPISFAREYGLAEQAFIRYQIKPNRLLNVSFIRVPWVLGKGSWFNAFFAKVIQTKQIIPLYGKGTNTMSFVLLSDLAQGLIELCKREEKQPVYHFAYKDTLTQKEFVKQIQSILNIPYKQVELSKYEKAIQEAFQGSIPLKPSRAFPFSNDAVIPKIEGFIRSYL